MTLLEGTRRFIRGHRSLLARTLTGLTILLLVTGILAASRSDDSNPGGLRLASGSSSSTAGTDGEAAAPGAAPGNGSSPLSEDATPRRTGDARTATATTTATAAATAAATATGQPDAGGQTETASGAPRAAPASASPGPRPDPSPEPDLAPSGRAEVPSPSPTPGGTTVPLQPEDAPRVLALKARSDEVGTGEALLVQVLVPGASDATLGYLDFTVPMQRDDDTFWAIIGVPLSAPPGSLGLVVTLMPEGSVFETSAAVAVVSVERPVDQLALTESEASILTPEAAALESQLRAEQFARFDRGRRWAGLFTQPTTGIRTTDFGQARSINGGPATGFHSGADIANVEGTPIVAAAPARVAWVGEMPIRGNTVILDHGAGVLTHYSHLSEIAVEEGQHVAAGEPIGAMGSTGLSTGPHLHWELSVYGINVDPFTWTSRDFTPNDDFSISEPPATDEAASEPTPTPGSGQ